MLKISAEKLERMELQYPGIRQTILFFENADLPCCSFCGSDNTADVNVGVVGRSIYIGAATTKFRLIPNEPRPGAYYCNTCKKYFD